MGNRTYHIWVIGKDNKAGWLGQYKQIPRAMAAFNRAAGDKAYDAVVFASDDGTPHFCRSKDGRRPEGVRFILPVKSN